MCHEFFVTDVTLSVLDWIIRHFERTKNTWVGDFQALVKDFELAGLRTLTACNCCLYYIDL